MSQGRCLADIVQFRVLGLVWDATVCVISVGGKYATSPHVLRAVIDGSWTDPTTRLTQFSFHFYIYVNGFCAFIDGSVAADDHISLMLESY